MIRDIGLVVSMALTILSGIAAFWFLFLILGWTFGLPINPTNSLLRLAIWAACSCLFFYSWRWQVRLEAKKEVPK